MRRTLLATLWLSSSVATADEGVWLLNHFPSAQVKARYGFSPSEAWLHQVQVAAVRFGGARSDSCTGSFVSADGLILTVHQCARRCLDQISTANDDRVKLGFFADSQDEEVRCPDIEVNALLDIQDVTAEVQKAIAGLDGKAYIDAQEAVSARLEKACADSDPNPEHLKCEVIPLFHGARFDLYKYRRYQDVRMVFSVEFASAFFGGDPDNFNFPRYALELGLMRAYEDGKPVHPPAHFKVSAVGTKPGDLTFVAGNSTGSNRAWTLAQLYYERDVAGQDVLLHMAELRGLLLDYQARGTEEARESEDLLYDTENTLKLYKGRYAALHDPDLMEPKIKAEAELRAWIAASSAWKKKAGVAFEAIAKAQRFMQDIRYRYYFLEGGGLRSSLFGFARALVRAAAERPKPSADRLPEFGDSAEPELMQRLFSAAPIYAELERTTLAFSLSKFREDLGADDPLVRKVLGVKSPQAYAKALVEGTYLADVGVRRQLWEGGAKAIAASTDPMIGFAQLVDADARKVRGAFEDDVEAVVKKNQALLGEARRRLIGTSTYPETTATLRLNYGTVKTWLENGVEVPPYTTFGGAFDRATGAAPFALPPSWLKAKGALHLDTPLNFISTNDVFTGDSGSAVLDRAGQVVGLVFDGNIHSLGGDFGYQAAINRAVLVDSRAIFEALRHIYGADWLVKELER